MEEVINLYGEKLLRYATTILCDYHEAEDVVQEAFLSAYTNRSNFDGNNLTSWLYKITYNRCLNKLKKRKLIYFGEIFKVSTSTGDDDLSDQTLCALKRLKPKERALLYGRIMDRQSYKELARLLGGSPVVLRKRYERAKKKLANYLTTECYRKELKYERI